MEAWHTEHGKRVMANAKNVVKTCVYVKNTQQKEYRDTSSRFCSNACKSEFRRQSGKDNTTRVCTICGESFTTNRYTKKQTCSPNCSLA